MNENYFDDIPAPSDENFHGGFAPSSVPAPYLQDLNFNKKSKEISYVDDNYPYEQKASYRDIPKSYQTYDAYNSSENFLYVGDPKDQQNSEPICNFDLINYKFTPGEETILDIFREGGKLSSSAKFFKERQPQVYMVKAILAALRDKKHLVVEAGTGTGKTFAYLIPLLKLGKKIVVSTKTKNLQDQLADKDVSYLVSIFKDGYKVALLKGRENYLCMRQIYNYNPDDFKTRHSKGFEEIYGPVPHLYYEQIKSFADHSLTGDISEFRYSEQKLYEEDIYISRFVARSATCLGKKCNYFTNCFLNNARDAAQTADLVIVNHSLYLANVKIGLLSDGCFSMLPSDTDLVVFDEAHHLLDDVRNSFANEVKSSDVKEFIYLLNESLSNLRSALSSNNNLSMEEQTEIENLFSFTAERLKKQVNDMILDLYRCIRKIVAPISSNNFQLSAQNFKKKNEPYSCTLANVANSKEFFMICENACINLSVLMDDFKDKADDYKLFEDVSPILTILNKLLEEFFDFISSIKSFTKKENIHDIENVRIIKSSEKFFSFTTIPLDVADIFSRHVLQKKKSNNDDIDISSKVPKFLFTSATLQVNRSFDNFTHKLGLSDYYTCALPSPFDYRKHSCIYIPQQIPNGKEYGNSHIDSVVKFALPLILKISGGVLVLCTSNNAMNSIFYHLSKLKDTIKRNIYCQNDTNKAELIRTMQREKNSLVVATQSFWEGVDIRGSALSCVIIDRLPFKNNKDPLVDALNNYYQEKLGKSGFISYSLPEMIVNLKQGVGRLIRSEDDIGVIAIADHRISVDSTNYSNKIRRDLPPMRIVRNIEEMLNFMDEAKSVSEEFKKDKSNANKA